MTACLKEDASACIGMATHLGPGRLKHVEIKHFALQHWDGGTGPRRGLSQLSRL